jgi:hypothetical protein
VLGQVVDAVREQRHLDLGLARVVLVAAEREMISRFSSAVMVMCGRAG